MSDAGLNRETLVYVLVESQGKTTAVRRAKSTIDTVVKAASRPIEAFHDYHMFHGDDVERLTEVWGDLPSAAPIESEPGEAMLEEGLERSEKLFEEYLGRVEELLELYTPAELQRNVENARLDFLRLGATVGPSVILYCESGYGIRHREELQKFVDSHGEVWIVPVVGVH